MEPFATELMAENFVKNALPEELIFKVGYLGGEEANLIPIVCRKLKKDTGVDWTLYDLEDRLRMHGWMVPAYPIPENLKNIDVQRLVLRQDFGMQLAIHFINEMKQQIDILNNSRIILRNNDNDANPIKGFDHSGR